MGSRSGSSNGPADVCRGIAAAHGLQDTIRHVSKAQDSMLATHVNVSTQYVIFSGKVIMGCRCKQQFCRDTGHSRRLTNRPSPEVLVAVLLHVPRKHISRWCWMIQMPFTKSEMIVNGTEALWFVKMNDQPHVCSTDGAPSEPCRAEFPMIERHFHALPIKCCKCDAARMTDTI